MNNIFNEKSKIGKILFNTMLKSLDNPFRIKINNPEKIVNASGILAGQNVLEIGSGSGFFTTHISKKIGINGLLHSIDLHPISVKETLNKVKKNNLTNVNVLKQDAMKTNFNNSQFDLVLLYGVIPSPGIISTKKLLNEIYRLLKPHGKLAIWSAVPFWSKKTINKSGKFFLELKKKGVYVFKKQ